MVVHGPPRTELSITIFILAGIAPANTVLIIDRYLITPITQLESAAASIAEGPVDTDVPDVRHSDAVGQLVESFTGMAANLQLIAEQAAALANQAFEAPVLDRLVPGHLGSCSNG